MSADDSQVPTHKQVCFPKVRKKGPKSYIARLESLELSVLPSDLFQLSRLSELEEMVAEQDNALAVAAEKYKKSRNEVMETKKEHEEDVENFKQQMTR